MSAVFSRRAALSGAVASVAMVGVGVAGAAAIAPAARADATFPAEWHALVAEWRRLNAIQKIDADLFNAAEEEKCALMRATPEPAKAKRVSPIREDMTIEQIKALPAEAFVEPANTEWHQWCAARDELSRRLVDPANDRWAASLSAADDAMQRVQNFPAVSSEMVIAKLALLVEHYGTDLRNDTEELAGIVADVSRLHRGEGRANG